MRREKISEAISEMDSRHIEEAVNFRIERKSRKLWLRWAVPAACTALILMVAPFAVQWIREINIPVYNEAIFTAEDIDSLFSEMLNDGTNSYQKVSVSSADELYIASAPDEEYVKIYEYDSSGKVLNQNEFSDYLNDILSKLSDALDEKMPEFEIEDNSSYRYMPSLDTRRVTMGEYGFTAYQSKVANRISVYSDGPSKQVMIHGQTIQVDQTETDEEIIESLATVKKDLFRIFGVNFKDVKVVRTYRDSKYGVQWLNVYFYNADDHEINEYCFDAGFYRSGAPVSDYLLLSFDNTLNYADDVVSDKILTNVSVVYYKYRVKTAERYTATAKVRMLSLGEAEELLSQGYVFGGHSCPLCMAEQTPVDFSDYDFVGFTYIFGRDDEGNTSGIGIPFYVFYKWIGTGNYDEIYAKTYVPAVEVSGLKEYFESQQEKHK